MADNQQQLQTRRSSPKKGKTDVLGRSFKRESDNKWNKTRAGAKSTCFLRSLMLELAWFLDDAYLTFKGVFQSFSVELVKSQDIKKRHVKIRMVKFQAAVAETSWHDSYISHNAANSIFHWPHPPPPCAPPEKRTSANPLLSALQ